MPLQRLVYPFPAIIGQDKLKLALILNIINPRIGGVLITGAKGTGKSTAVRALNDLLTEIEVVDGCKFNCSPIDVTNMCEICLLHFQNGETLPVKKIKMQLIQLPLSATEDRVVGSLDTERALREGLKAFQPGLLAEANQNILYIDEVNLLSEHLAHTILDPAASGMNVIQRESISLIHPSRFILVASMNPEEGDLKPQILDRFALHANAITLNSTNQRLEIMSRNTIFEEDPFAFRKMYEHDLDSLRQKIIAARKILPKVKTPEHLFKSVAKICAELQVDGHRPDIATIKAAEALAAFNGRTEVKPEDILTVSELALTHRRRKSGLEPPLPAEKIRGALKEVFTELRVVVPTVSEGTKLPNLSPQQIEDAVKQFFGLFGTKKNVKSQSRRKRKQLPRILSILMTPILLLLASYFLSVLVLTFYFMLFNPPVEGISSVFSFKRVLPLMLPMIVGILIISLLTSRRKKPSTLFIYERKGSILSRRIINQHISSEEVLNGGAAKEQLLALRGAYVRRLYKALIGYGRKIAESLYSIKPSKEQLPIMMEQEVRGRRYHLVGRHTKTITSSQQGRYVWYEFPKKRPWDIALAPTIRAAAPYQKDRKIKDLLVKIEPQDVRVKVREARTPHTIVLLIDMSESMATSLNNVRDAVLNLHKRAYSRRDRIGLVVFKGSEAHIIQPPTSNLNLAIRQLLKVGASDFTPLAAGMLKAWKLFRIEKYRNKDIIPILVIISDGIANVPLDRPLSPFTRTNFRNPSQADTIDAAHLLAKDQIQTVIINTDHRQEEHWPKIYETSRFKWYTPNNLLLEITRILGGRYYGISEKGEIQRVVLTEALTTTSMKPL